MRDQEGESQYLFFFFFSLHYFEYYYRVWSRGGESNRYILIFKWSYLDGNVERQYVFITLAKEPLTSLLPVTTHENTRHPQNVTDRWTDRLTDRQSALKNHIHAIEIN